MFLQHDVELFGLVWFLGDANDKAAAMVNGEDATSSDNGDDTPRKCDTIVITGKKDQCEGAKQALLVRNALFHLETSSSHTRT